MLCGGTGATTATSQPPASLNLYVLSLGEFDPFYSGVLFGDGRK